MRWTNSAAAGPLLLAITALLLLWEPSPHSAPFLVEAIKGEESCAEAGLCLAPEEDDDSSDDDSGDSGDDDSGDSSDDSGDPQPPRPTMIPRRIENFVADDDSSDDSSDDENDPGHGNRYAHVPDDEDPEDNQATCHTYLDLSGHHYLSETASFYQEIGWSEHVDTLDVCMTLDDIVQICDSYRPHYHEPFVHFPAAYLQEMKRVCFIGGGDAMLLHEALKYPNVELVLGLELDQKNVRESLKHFRVRPHFEDPRVQWWFGDAAKSLALLPREWFGTFDLVMVDLSETGMSISVNDDLDIFGALALLLKPEGIMVKNENYFGQMSKYFDHSVSVYMDQYPKLCDQDWAMGSNKVDFLRPKIRSGLVEENKVKTLAYLPLDDDDEHYKMIIDYAHNDARKQGLCDDDVAKKDAVEKESVKPTKSMGILLVVDADNATKNLDLGGFKSALGELGMTPLEPSCLSLPSDGATTSLFIGMEEGYVSAHSYPERPSSIGLEILLWSKLGKQSDVLQSLLDVIGVDEKSYSSYRVIHGGVNGHKNWKEEADAVGPFKKNTRECDPDVKAIDTEGHAMPAEHFSMVVAESMALLAKKSDKTAAVLCGVRGVHECVMLDTLKQARRVESVIAIWTCPEDTPPGKVKETEEEEEDENGTSISHVYACGEEAIMQSTKAKEGYSALIVDPNAPTHVVQMGEAIFCSDRILKVAAHPYLRERVTFVTPLSSEAHNGVFERCRRRISKRLIRSGVLVLDKSVAAGIVASANDSFPRQLVKVAENVESKTGSTAEIDKIKSGPVPFQGDYDPDNASQGPYEPQEAMRQYVQQVPLASQSVYQLEVKNEEEVKELSRTFVKEVLDLIVGKSTRFASSQRSYFEVGDGSVAVALTSGGHLYVTWNGAGLFTINTLTDGEDYKPVHRGRDLGPDVVLLDHKTEVVDAFVSKLPASTVVAAREQMPRGADRVVNFKVDMSGTPGCADYYHLCKEFAKDGDCNSKEERKWMRQNCALSCGACDKMAKSMQ